MLTAATLFSGGGGADIGLTQSGFKVLWGVEKDEAIAKVYQQNFQSELIVNDVFNVDPNELEPVDLLHASPPCQQYSAARRGDLPRHQEADAGLAIASYLEILHPKFFTLENVPGYVKSESFCFIVDLLHRLGYWTHWDIYDAASFGIPSDRKRLFLRASRVGFCFPMPKNNLIQEIASHQNRGWYQAIADLIPSLPDSTLANWQVPIIEKTRHRPLLIPRAGANTETVGARQAHQPSHTIRAFKKWRGSHWADIVLTNSVRRITPRCTARLMTFPDDYLLPSNGLAQRILGNSVPPRMMEAIANSFLVHQL